MQAFSKDNKEIKYLQTIAHACSRILKERRPCEAWVDRVKEFYNKDVQKLLELYSTENEEKSCVIERFNRTIKDRKSTRLNSSHRL